MAYLLRCDIGKKGHTRKGPVAADRWNALDDQDPRSRSTPKGALTLVVSQFFAVANADGAALLFIGERNMWGRLWHAWQPSRERPEGPVASRTLAQPGSSSSMSIFLFF
jgi:hypothetical protein